MSLEHKPRAVTTKLKINKNPARYQWRAKCENCHYTFKVFILRGRYRRECNEVCCPNCGCQVRL
jgi:hypothetical protein